MHAVPWSADHCSLFIWLPRWIHLRANRPPLCGGTWCVLQYHPSAILFWPSPCGVLCAGSTNRQPIVLLIQARTGVLQARLQLYGRDRRAQTRDTRSYLTFSNMDNRTPVHQHRQLAMYAIPPSLPILHVYCCPERRITRCASSPSPNGVGHLASTPALQPRESTD